MQISMNTDETGKRIQSMMVSYEKNFHSHIKEGMESLIPLLSDSIRANFESAGKRGDGQQWLTKHNPTPLIDTGKLYRSFNGIVEERGKNYVVIIGTDVEYAKVHNEGGVVKTDVVPRPKEQRGRGPRTQSMWLHTKKFKQKEIPKREFMFLTVGDDWNLDDAQMIEDQIDETMDIIAELEGLELA